MRWLDMSGYTVAEVAEPAPDYGSDEQVAGIVDTKIQACI